MNGLRARKERAFECESQTNKPSETHGGKEEGTGDRQAVLDEGKGEFLHP